jgi:hypothetical protein
MQSTEEPQPPGLPQPLLEALASAQSDEHKRRAAAVTSVQHQLQGKLDQSQKLPDLQEVAQAIEVLDQHQHAAEFFNTVLKAYAPLIEQVMASAGIKPEESLQEFFSMTPSAKYAWVPGTFLGGSVALGSAQPVADLPGNRQPSKG